MQRWLWVRPWTSLGVQGRPVDMLSLVGIVLSGLACGLATASLDPDPEACCYTVVFFGTFTTETCGLEL